MKHLATLAWMAWGLLATTADAAPVATASSPDGLTKIAIDFDPDGRINYSISRKDQPLIAPSRLGLLLTDGYALVRDFELVGQQTAEGDDRWEQPWGERHYVRDHYRELLTNFRQQSTGRLLSVRFRLFDQGVGFRYEVPSQAGLATLHIADEVTEFDIARPGTAWWQPGGESNRYEYLYNKTPIDGVATAHTPMTMRLDDGTHLAVHEAALVDYASMWLKREQGQKFRATLSPSSQGPRVTRALPFATPWRAIRMADNAAGLVENDLELNLNEPNKIGDVSWFKPQKYIGIWWGMIRGDWTWAEGAKHGATTRAVISGEAFLTLPGAFSALVVEAISAETGVQPEISTSGGTSDARFLKSLCPVIEFGLSNATMHKRDEAVAVADLESLARIYRRIVQAALQAG